MPQRKISEVVKGQELLTVLPSISVLEAARKMAAKGVGALVVAEVSGQLDGIFTERDVLVRVVAEGLDPAKTLVGKVMTPKPATVEISGTVHDALRIMDDKYVRHCVVVDGAKVVGIISMRDFVSAEVAELEFEHEGEKHLAEEML